MKIRFLIIALFLSFQMLAQSNGSLNGTILDDSKQTVIEFATVSLTSVVNPSIILGGKTNLKGIFFIQNIPLGEYNLKVSSIGYNTKEIKGVSIASVTSKDLGKIKLQANSRSLKDVTVVGEKATIQLAADKKVFNVDKNITSAGGTAEDVMRNIPSVSVDMDGNVSLRGKDNVTFLVDGKPSAMFGSDPVTALQTIPAASIESIEVITNPSSKYDAQGMSGILNIILKKDKKPGYNGMVNVGIGYPYRLNGGINFNANIKKWNVFLNANGRTSKTWEETNSNRTNYDNENTYSSFSHNDRRPLNGFGNVGFEYQADAKNKISLTQSIFNAAMKGNSTTTIDNGVRFENLISRQIRSNEYVGKPLSSTTNLQWNHKFKKPKEELNLEANFSTVRYIRESNYETRFYDSSLNLLNTYAQENPIKGGNYNVTLQADYTKPFLEKGRFDIGIKSYFIQFKSENQPIRSDNGGAEYAETILKNHFIFNQQIHAAYLNVFNQFGNTGVQVGLRAENFNYSGTVYQYNASASNQYTSLFPTLFITQKINDNQDITLNYSRRVNRPDFRQLIPYIDVSNPQDTSTGNPNLKPEFIHSAELGYNYRYGKSNTFIGSIYYQYTNDLIQRYRRFNENGTTFSQNRNLATGQTYGLELINKNNINPNWDLTTTLNLFRNKIDGSNIDSTLTRGGYGGFAKMMSNYKIDKTWSAQLVGNYFAQTVISQGVVKPYGNVDFAVKKTLMKNLITMTLNVNDVFNTIQTTSVYNYFPAYNQSVKRKNLTRSVTLNFQMKFASKSMRNAKPTDMKKMNKNGKVKSNETKSRDENLKKDEEGGDDSGGGGNR